MKKLFVLFLVLTIMNSYSQETKKREITDAQIDAVFSQWNDSNRAGIAVGIVNDGEIVYSKGFGQANLEHQVPIETKTKFHIGDLAKEFTVYALLLLEQRGQFSLGDDIRTHLPKLSSFAHAVSIEQLIHHTAGLNNEEASKALAGWRSEDIFTKEQAYTMVNNMAETMPKSGSVQRFSDAGFMILEDLITAKSNMSYADFVSKEIFKPLGMTNSVFDTQGAVIANKAQGYFALNNGFAIATMTHRHTLLSDLYTTVEDMCLWLKELRNPSVGTVQMVEKFDGLSVVNKKKVNRVNAALYTGSHRFWDFRGAIKLYHIEVAGGYASKLIRYPEYDLSIVIMGNDGAYNGFAATGATELYIEDFLDPMPSNNLPKIQTKKLSKKQLMAFEGDYWDTNNHTSRKIQLVNDTLRYIRGPRNQSPIVPLTKKKFQMVTGTEVLVDFNSKSGSKTMDVTVGDDTFHSIAYDTNAHWTKDLSVFEGNYYSSTLDTSYSLKVDQGKLVLKHPRMEPINLDPKTPNVFSGNHRHFTSLSFNRNANGIIQGFQLSTFGVGDLRFQKEAISTENSEKTN